MSNSILISFLFILFIQTLITLNLQNNHFLTEEVQHLSDALRNNIVTFVLFSFLICFCFIQMLTTLILDDDIIEDDIIYSIEQLLE